MRIVCSWCRREGKAGIVGEKPPLDDPAETHGVCWTHLLMLAESLPSRSFPGVQMLIVVAPDDQALFASLRGRLAGVRGVEVIQDRRRADRRRAAQPVAWERRHGERRIHPGEVSPLGYRVVRFGRPQPRFWTCPRCARTTLTRERAPRCPGCGFVEEA